MPEDDEPKDWWLAAMGIMFIVVVAIALHLK